MKAEVPGPFLGMSSFKLKTQLKSSLLFVLGLVLPFVVLYFLAGMPLYDSFVIANGDGWDRGFTTTTESPPPLQ